MKTLVANPQHKSGNSNHYLFIQKKDNSDAANTFFSPKESTPDSSGSVYIQADSDDCVHSGGCDNPGPSDDEVHGDESPPEDKEDKEDKKETPDKEPETTEDDAPKKDPYQEILDTEFKFKKEISKNQLKFILAYFIKGAKILNSKKLDGARAVLMVGQAGQESSYAKKMKGNPNVRHHNYLGWQPIDKEVKQLEKHKEEGLKLTKEKRDNGPHGKDTTVPTFTGMDQAIKLGLDIAFGLKFKDAVHKKMGEAFTDKDNSKTAIKFRNKSGSWNQNPNYKRTLMNEIHRSKRLLLKILGELSKNDSLSAEAKALTLKLMASLKAITTFHTPDPNKK
ncbi:MAG: hypothetical protein ABJM06_10135 [Gilvibacter sp.]